MAFRRALGRGLSLHGLAPKVRQRRFMRTDLWQEKLQNRIEQHGADGSFNRRVRQEQGLQGADARKHGLLEQREATAEVRNLGQQRRWEEALAVFACVPEPDPLLRTAVMDACGKSGQLLHARRLFEEMPVKTVPAYNAFIALLGRMRRLREASALFAEMPDLRLEQSDITFTSLIDAHSMVSDAEGAAKVFSDMEARGLKASAITCGAVLAACGRAGDQARAAEFLSLMDRRQLQPGARHLSSVVLACVQNGDENGAQAAFAEFHRRGLRPTVITYTIMVKCLCSSDAMRKADALFAQMRAEGIFPDAFFYNALLGAAVRSHDWDRFEALLQEMDQSGLPRTRETDLRVREMEEARRNLQASPPLPPGWREAVDPGTGRAYYWQEQDPAGTTTWDRPL
mmetsp:Transcript_91879/g.230938  ORF Transcript_91879/g.230938 Transcript_91879/m.230938 type:complete len:399 (-) Transcript_91879:12-1208(-)